MTIHNFNLKMILMVGKSDQVIRLWYTSWTNRMIVSHIFPGLPHLIQAHIQNGPYGQKIKLKPLIRHVLTQIHPNLTPGWGVGCPSTAWGSHLEIGPQMDRFWVPLDTTATLVGLIQCWKPSRVNPYVTLNTRYAPRTTFEAAQAWFQFQLGLDEVRS